MATRPPDGPAALTRPARRLLANLPAFAGLLLLAGALFVVQREFRHLDVRDVGHALAAIPRRALILAAIWTVAGYGLLTLYDRLGSIYAGRPVSYWRSAFASFCAYALSHNLGFAALSGAAVRYRLYAHWGFTPVQIGKIVAFCSLSFGLGGLVLGGGILLGEPAAVPYFGTHVPPWLLAAAGGAMWAVVAFYLAMAALMPALPIKNRRIELPHARMAMAQVVLACGEVAVTATIFYALLPHGHGLTWVRFLAVYLGAYAAGLAANVPGGLGVFDTAMLLGLEPYFAAPVVIGAIFVYRLFYYVVPLFLAGILFAGNELLLSRTRLPATLAARTRGVRMSEPDFAVAASAGGVAFCGAMLLSIGILDTHPDYSWVDPDFAIFAASAGQYTPSLIGTGLMVLAVGLAQRVTLAWLASILVLLAGAGVTSLQGEPYWVPVILVVAALSVAPFRGLYYRGTLLLSQKLQAGSLVPVLALLMSVLWLASFEPKIRALAHTSWWAVVLSRDTPVPIRAAVSLAVMLALLALWGVIRPGRVQCLPWNAAARLRYAALGALPPPEADGLVMGEAGRAGIAFKRIDRVLLGLHDPAGAPSDRVCAIWRLRDLAQQEGRHPAIWHASGDFLRVYGDLGLTALPLGPDGMPITGMETSPAPGQFYLCCVAEQDLRQLLPLLPDLGRRQLQVPAQ